MVEKSQDVWFTSYPYGNTYSFSTQDETLHWLGQEKDKREMFGAVIIGVHVGTSYGKPFVEQVRYNQSDLKRLVLRHRLTPAEKTNIFQSLGIKPTKKELAEYERRWEPIGKRSH